MKIKYYFTLCFNFYVIEQIFGEEKLNFFDENKAILVLGNVGSGKSTLVQYLTQDPSKITVIDKGNSFEVLNGSASSMMFDDHENVWYDCPGFQDTNVANFTKNMFMKTLTTEIKKLKLVFVSDYRSITVGYRQKEFKYLLTNVTSLMPNNNVERYDIILVITKVEPTMMHQNVPMSDEMVISNTAGFLINTLNNIRDDPEENQDNGKLIEKFLHQTNGKYDRIGVFYRPNGSADFSKTLGARENLLKLIRDEIDYTTINPNDFNYLMTLVQENILKLLQQIDAALSNFLSTGNTTAPEKLEFERKLKNVKIASIDEMVKFVEDFCSTCITNELKESIKNVPGVIENGESNSIFVFPKTNRRIKKIENIQNNIDHIKKQIFSDDSTQNSTSHDILKKYMETDPEIVRPFIADMKKEILQNVTQALGHIDDVLENALSHKNEPEKANLIKNIKELLNDKDLSFDEMVKKLEDFISNNQINELNSDLDNLKDQQKRRHSLGEIDVEDNDQVKWSLGLPKTHEAITNVDDLQIALEKIRENLLSIDNITNEDLLRSIDDLKNHMTTNPELTGPIIDNMKEKIVQNVSQKIKDVDALLANALQQTQEDSKRKELMKNIESLLKPNIKTIDEMMEKLNEFNSIKQIDGLKDNLEKLGNQQRVKNILENAENKTIEQSKWNFNLEMTNKMISDINYWQDILSKINEKLFSYDIQKNSDLYKNENISDKQGLKEFFDKIGLDKDLNIEITGKELNDVKTSLESAFDVKLECENNIAFYKGAVIFLSRIDKGNCSDAKNIKIDASQRVFADQNADFRGLESLNINTHIFEVLNDVKIDLRGNDITTEHPPNRNGTVDDPSVLPGKSGFPGMNGVNFIANVTKLLNGKKLTIDVSGGRGGRGQDGSKAFSEIPEINKEILEKYNKCDIKTAIKESLSLAGNLVGPEIPSCCDRPFYYNTMRGHIKETSQEYIVHPRRCCQGNGRAGIGGLGGLPGNKTLNFVSLSDGEPHFIEKNGEEGEHGINFEACQQRKKIIIFKTKCKFSCEKRYEKCEFNFEYKDEEDENCLKQK